MGAALAATGCAARGTVSGKVTYKKQPLSTGTVIFFGPNNSRASSQIGPDGTYTISGILAGPAKIAVSTPPPAPAPGMAMKMDASKMGGPADAGKGAAQAKSLTIPPQYNDPDKSNLTYEVKAGEQQHDIELP
jgi:hypothetical protein